MADREDQSNLPPIPDGGLTDSMPDWLRRPPAWRTLPDREVSVPEPENTSALPEPDDSVIDPRTFLSDDDLPAWLRSLGPGRRRHADHPVQNDTESSRLASGPLAPEKTDVTTEAPRSRFTPTTPPTPVGSAAPPPSTRESAPRPPAPSVSAPAWQGAWLVALLAALLVVAISVIVVLVL